MSKRLQPDSNSDEETGKGSSSQPTDPTLASQQDLDPTINPEKRTKPSESPSPNLPAKESNEKTVDAGPQDDAGKPEDKDDDNEDDEDTGKEAERGLLTTLTSENCLVYWRLSVEKDMPLLRAACRQLTQREFHAVTSASGLVELPRAVIHEIVTDDQIRIDYEVDVIEIVLRWIGLENDRVSNSMEFFSQIRWAAIGRDCVRKRLLTNPLLSADPIIRGFLNRVLDFLSGGCPFAGLVTSHRPLTGIERSVFIVGSDTMTSVSPEVIRVSLQGSQVSLRGCIPTEIKREAAACVSPWSNTLFVSGVGPENTEIWQWSASGGWFRCANMSLGRRRHSMVFPCERNLFFVGGVARADNGPLSGVDKMDTQHSICIIVGHLHHAVETAACVVMNEVIYVIGGWDEHDAPVNHVQAFHSVHFTCTVFERPLPRLITFLRAVTWEHQVIVMCIDTCFVLDVAKQEWQERPQFQLGRMQCGCILEDGKLFMIGGAVNATDPASGQLKLELTDEVSYVMVADIIANRPAQWVQHAHLPEPSLVHAYAALNAAARR